MFYAFEGDKHVSVQKIPAMALESSDSWSTQICPQQSEIRLFHNLRLTLKFYMQTWILQRIISWESTIHTTMHTATFPVNGEVFAALDNRAILFELLSRFKVDLFDVAIIDAIATFTNWKKILFFLSSFIQNCAINYDTYWFVFDLCWCWLPPQHWAKRSKLMWEKEGISS